MIGLVCVVTRPRSWRHPAGASPARSAARRLLGRWRQHAAIETGRRWEEEFDAVSTRRRRCRTPETTMARSRSISKRSSSTSAIRRSTTTSDSITSTAAPGRNPSSTTGARRSCVPGDQATEWNLAIAATALRDWKTARSVWRGLGIEIDGEDGPIDGSFGQTPVRLNPDGEAEVVWATRLCPVRARINSIPFPESGFAYGDVVLHDGAPVGSRLDSNGREKSVFNVLEMFEPGPFTTYLVDLVAESVEQRSKPSRSCAKRAALRSRTGHSSVQTICRACSEGRPHEQHDHTPVKTKWNPERQIAVGAQGR